MIYSHSLFINKIFIVPFLKNTVKFLLKKYLQTGTTSSQNWCLHWSETFQDKETPKSFYSILNTILTLNIWLPSSLNKISSSKNNSWAPSNLLSSDLKGSPHFHLCFAKFLIKIFHHFTWKNLVQNFFQKNSKENHPQTLPINPLSLLSLFPTPNFFHCQQFPLSSTPHFH